MEETERGRHGHWGKGMGMVAEIVDSWNGAEDQWRGQVVIVG